MPFFSAFSFFKRLLLHPQQQPELLLSFLGFFGITADSIIYKHLLCPNQAKRLQNPVPIPVRPRIYKVVGRREQELNLVKRRQTGELPAHDGPNQARAVGGNGAEMVAE